MIVQELGWSILYLKFIWIMILYGFVVIIIDRFNDLIFHFTFWANQFKMKICEVDTTVNEPNLLFNIDLRFKWTDNL